MKLKVAKEKILQGLQIVQGVIGARSTLPILSNVLLQAEKDKLWLTTTDLDMSVRCGVEAEVTKTGASTLPARRLFSIIRELPAEMIEIEIDEKNTASITCGSSFFKILGLSEEEFPPLPKFDKGHTCSMAQDAFKDMLEKTSYAASSDETRHVLNGTLLSFKDGKVIAVATDGRRLALVEMELEFPKDAEADMIVPTKAVNEILRTAGGDAPVKIQAVKNQVAFQFGDTLIVSKLIDGTYPNFRQVIPKQSEERIVLERETFLTAVKRVALLTSERSNSVRLTFAKNKLKVSVSTPDVGEAYESVAVKYANKEISVAFNPEFILDPLRHLSSDEVFLEITDDLSPGVIKCEKPFIYVLMPMRVT